MGEILFGGGEPHLTPTSPSHKAVAGQSHSGAVCGGRGAAALLVVLDALGQWHCGAVAVANHH